MSAEKDITIDEKRVYGAKTGATVAYVASAAGLVRVRCSGDRVGEFGLAWRGDCRDAAVRPADEGGGAIEADHDAVDRLAVATTDDVLLSPDGDSFEGTGFGPASAVGYRDGDLLAAGDGRIGRYDGNGWDEIGACDDVRAFDESFVAAKSGVFRIDDEAGLTGVGLSDAYDVYARRVPRAATASGLYRLGNGWMDDRDGDFRVVAGDGDRVHAASTDRLYERDGGEWVAVDLPIDERVVGVAYADRAYVVTADGTFLVERDDGGWSTRSLGLPDVRGLIVA